jgi:XTP/dITP diphosphohydrolase
MPRRLSVGSRLVLASHNTGKLREIAELVRPFGLEVASVSSLGLPEPQENARDFVGNARIKAVAAAKGSGLPALADDSGFCVAALGGAPGVFSARWAGPDRDFRPAMERVNAMLGAAEDRRAWFVAALCLGWPDGHTATFIGRVDGTVVWPPRGTRGFGYDPIFQPIGSELTFGEMLPEQKHPVSHRARGFVQLQAACLGHPGG